MRMLSKALILVVVEDGLRDTSCLKKNSLPCKEALILVVVEDGLRGVTPNQYIPDWLPP